MGWGGARQGSGRKPKASNDNVVAPKSLVERKAVPAEARSSSPSAAAMFAVADLVKQLTSRVARTADNNPFRIAVHPPKATPPKKLQMAYDNALVANTNFAAGAWLTGGQGFISNVELQGLLFPGFSYLAELAQRPEYRILSETLPDDATRKWIEFEVVGDEEAAADRKKKDPVGELERQADPDEREKRIKQSGKADKVKALRDDQERLSVRKRFYEVSRDDGFFGRSHLYINVGTDVDGDQKELITPLGDGRDEASRGKIAKGSFKELKVIEAIWTYPMAYNALNPLMPGWYDPQVWYVMGQQIHGSRLRTFIGRPVPDLLKPSYSFGGISTSQLAQPYVDIWLQTRSSIAQLIKSFSVMNLETDLNTILQGQSAEDLIARVAMFNAMRDNMGTFVTNKDTEGFKNIAAPLSGLHELQAQSQEHLSFVGKYPLVKLTGISPSGLNASSEGEIQIYYDGVGAFQNRFMKPELTRVINFEQLSLFGEVDPEITFKFESLYEMSPKERSEKEKADAERNQTYVDMGALAPAEIRKAIIEDPDLPYTGLDPVDVPDLELEESQGLEPEGGRPQLQVKPEGEPGDDSEKD